MKKRTIITSSLLVIATLAVFSVGAAIFNQGSVLTTIQDMDRADLCVMTGCSGAVWEPTGEVNYKVVSGNQQMMVTAKYLPVGQTTVTLQKGLEFTSWPVEQNLVWMCEKKLKNKWGFRDTICSTQAEIQMQLSDEEAVEGLYEDATITVSVDGEPLLFGSPMRFVVVRP